MAKRTTDSKESTAKPRVYLGVSVQEASKLLLDRVQEGEKLVTTQPASEQALQELRQAYKVWNDYNAALLERLFTTSELAKEYTAFHGRVTHMGADLYERTEYVHRDIRDKLTRLRSVENRLQLYTAPTEVVSDTEKAPQVEVRGQDIFVVHGHNQAVTQTVARFLERLNLTVLILAEQPNQGRTIIEKFLDYANVGFAVVLMTLDDMGNDRESAKSGKLNGRARQNVILELGFFIGKLGRHRVCALKEPGVEVPSDIQGVLYIEIDPAGAWKLQLAKEIKTAGVELDLNQAII